MSVGSTAKIRLNTGGICFDCFFERTESVKGGHSHDPRRITRKIGVGIVNMSVWSHDKSSLMPILSVKSTLPVPVVELEMNKITKLCQ